MCGGMSGLFSLSINRDCIIVFRFSMIADFVMMMQLGLPIF